MVAGPVYRKGRVAGGARSSNGVLLYGGLRRGYSGGHLHRASVWQRCEAADFANAIFRQDLFLEFLKSQGMDAGTDLRNLESAVQDSLRNLWADYVHHREMIILYHPGMEQH